MTEFFQGMGTLCPRWLPGHLLSVEESRLARRPPLKAARSGLYASERIHHWDWFEFEANAKTFKPWTGRFFGRLLFRRNGTENRVKQMAHFVPNRCRSIPPVRACKTLAYDFFRFVSWPQLSRFEGMGKNRRIKPREKMYVQLKTHPR